MGYKFTYEGKEIQELLDFIDNLKLNKCGNSDVNHKHKLPVIKDTDIDEISIVNSNNIVQKKLMECFAGFDSGDADTQIFSGAQNAPQGLAYINHNGVEKVFLLQRVEGTVTWGSDEYHRIVEYDLKEDGSIVNPVSYSHKMRLGHQGLSAVSENGKIYIYAPLADDIFGDTGKGYCKIEWNGYNTNSSNMKKYKLFGD